jgi:hypothetical protein
MQVRAWILLMLPHHSLPMLVQDLPFRKAEGSGWIWMKKIVHKRRFQTLVKHSSRLIVGSASPLLNHNLQPTTLRVVMREARNALGQLPLPLLLNPHLNPPKQQLNYRV